MTQRRRWTPLAPRQACGLCGKPVRGTWLVSPDGRVVCDRHGETVGCTWCGFPASFTLDDFNYCRECRSRAVVTAEQITRLGHLIKASLSPRSCWLADRVTLRIHSRQTLAGTGHDTPDALGMTAATVIGGRLAGQQIWVRYGLPEEVCLLVLTHEYAHALLNHHGRTSLADIHCEGFCQYLAGIVVREQLPDSKPAVARRAHELSRPDLYGRGMRLVTAAADRHGEAQVISAFLDGGTEALKLPVG